MRKAMKYQRYGDCYAVRLEIGDEVCISLLRLAELENIRFAEISGIGATNMFTISVFDTAKKQYYANDFTGAYEITSLLGTLTVQNGDPYLHLHMNAGDRSGAVFGGHLTRAIISATCEIIVRCIPGEMNRRRDPETGINLFDL